MALYPQPISAKAIDLKPSPPEFQRHFANIVGNAASNADGFEFLFRPLAAHVASGRGFLTGFDSDLAEIGALPRELDGRFHRDFADSLARTIKGGQGAFNSFAVHLTGNNAPGAKPVGTPVSGGGGLQPVAFGQLQFGAQPKFVTVPFTNPQDHVIHPTGIKIEQGRLQVFVASNNCGGSIPAHGECEITIEFRPLLPGHYTGLLVFNTDDPNSPYTISLSGTVTPRASGGTGGGGIGPGVANDPFGMGGSGPSGIGGRILV